MFVLPPENTFFQILIDDQQNFSIKADANNFTASAEIEGSQDNIIFYDYLKFIEQARNEKTGLQQELQNTSNANKKDEIEKKIIELDRTVLKKQDDILNNHPNRLSDTVIVASRNRHIADCTNEIE